MATDSVVKTTEVPPAPPMAAMMLQQFKETVTPVLEEAKPPKRVLDAWLEFLAALKEWIGA